MDWKNNNKEVNFDMCVRERIELKKMKFDYKNCYLDSTKNE